MTGGRSMKSMYLIFGVLSVQLVASPLKIGHRGACGYAPENTLASFEKAVELGVDMIELDVFVCASGELVVIHDHRVDATTNGSGYVDQMSLWSLKNLDAGGGQQIPMLREVFDLVNRRVCIDIELKAEGTAQAVAELIAEYILLRGWRYEDFIVTSFNHHELRLFKSLVPEVSIGALYTGIPLDYAQCAQKLAADYMVVSSQFINQQFVDDAHARGVQIFVYTVDHPEDISRMKVLGVDGICSNYPDRI